MPRSLPRRAYRAPFRREREGRSLLASTTRLCNYPALLNPLPRTEGQGLG